MTPDSGRSVRRSQFHDLRRPLASSSPAESQARRRQNALEWQRQQRQKAFSLTREGLDTILDDLDIDTSEDEDGTQHEASHEAADRITPAITDETMEGEAGPSRAHDRKAVKRSIKKKWKGYAGRLMYGEDLDLAEGLPADLENEWLALGPIPEGKRCMAVTFHGTRINKKGRVTNTLLLSRVSGRPLSRHLVPALPPDCVLDCVYSEEHCALFVVDVLRWKSQSLAETEAEFRMFWRDSKLSELPPQPLPRSPPTLSEDNISSQTSGQRHIRRKPAQLLAVPIPCSTPPLAREALTQLVKHCIHRERVSFSAVVAVEDVMPQKSSLQQIELALPCNGLLLLVKSASYESGLTPLAAWVGKNEFPPFLQSLCPPSIS